MGRAADTKQLRQALIQDGISSAALNAILQELVVLHRKEHGPALQNNEQLQQWLISNLSRILEERGIDRRAQSLLLDSMVRSRMKRM